MKLQAILTEYNPVPGSTDVSSVGNNDPFTSGPNRTPNNYEKDFVDKEWELEFLRRLKGRKEAKSVQSGIPINRAEYGAFNRIKNLRQAGLIEIISKSGKQFAFISPEGEAWLEQFGSQQHGALKPLNVDAGGWNPVSGASATGGMY